MNTVVKYRGAEHTLDVCSPSGYVREAAVKALVSTPQRGTLPMLLLRLNDWVPQVQWAAVAAVRALMQTEYLPDWSASLDAVAALRRARRRDHEPMLTEIARFLGQSEHLPHMVKASKKAGLYARRYVFELTWSGEPNEERRVDLLERALCGKDAVVAEMAMQHVERMASLPVKRRLYEAACKAPLAHARSTAVCWLVENPDDNTDALMARVCLDPVASVRWWCAHRLRASGGLDAAVSRAVALAVDEHSASRQRSAAMQFLNEVQPEAALRFCEPWLNSVWPRLRRDAIAIRLAQAARQDKVKWLQQAFADPALRVQRLLLDKNHVSVWGPSMEQLLQPLEQHPCVMLLHRFLALSTLHDGWHRLCGLLRAGPLCVGTSLEPTWMGALKTWAARGDGFRYRPDSALAAQLAQEWSAMRAHVLDRYRQLVEQRLHAFDISVPSTNLD